MPENITPEEEIKQMFLKIIIDKADSIKEKCYDDLRQSLFEAAFQIQILVPASCFAIFKKESEEVNKKENGTY
jgi:hypothetical protein